MPNISPAQIIFLVCGLIFYLLFIDGSGAKQKISAERLQEDFDSMSDEEQNAIRRQRTAISLSRFAVFGSVCIPALSLFIFPNNPDIPKTLSFTCFPLGILAAIFCIAYAAVTAIRYRVSDVTIHTMRGGTPLNFPVRYRRGIWPVLNGILGLVMVVPCVVTLLAMIVLSAFPWLVGGS